MYCIQFITETEKGISTYEKRFDIIGQDAKNFLDWNLVSSTISSDTIKQIIATVFTTCNIEKMEIGSNYMVIAIDLKQSTFEIKFQTPHFVHKITGNALGFYVLQFINMHSNTLMESLEAFSIEELSHLVRIHVI